MKVLLTVKAGAIAPRFDLATEVLIARIGTEASNEEPRTILMSGPSGDELCTLVLREAINVVVCGGIEESFYQYLEWTKVRVIDRVIGQTDVVLDRLGNDTLTSGMVVRNKSRGERR